MDTSSKILLRVLKFYGWKEFNVIECAKNAYIDSSRPLIGIGQKMTPTKESDLDKWKKDIYEWIKCRILNYPCNEKNFMDWHIETCDGEEGIIEKSTLLFNKSYLSLDDPRMKYFGSKLPYGIAQKWLNITIKNILIGGCIGLPEENEVRRAFKSLNNVKDIHIPVDSIIIGCTKELIKKLQDDGANYKKHFEMLNTSWSRWTRENYKMYQEEMWKLLNTLRDKEEYNKRDWCTPIDWEFDVWPKKRDGMSIFMD